MLGVPSAMAISCLHHPLCPVLLNILLAATFAPAPAPALSSSRQPGSKPAPQQQGASVSGCRRLAVSSKGQAAKAMGLRRAAPWQQQGAPAARYSDGVVVVGHHSSSVLGPLPKSHSSRAVGWNAARDALVRRLTS